FGLQNSRDRCRAPGPVCRFGLELPPATACERVVLRAPRIRGVATLGVEPPGSLEPCQRGQQRPGIDLEHSARDLLDPARDAEAMHGFEAERLENQHVQSALYEIVILGIHAEDATAISS